MYGHITLMVAAVCEMEGAAPIIGSDEGVCVLDEAVGVLCHVVSVIVLLENGTAKPPGRVVDKDHSRRFVHCKKRVS